MRDLTDIEFNGLKALAKNDLISQVGIDILGSEMLRVIVVSKDGADFNGVDALLREIFPTMEYRGSVGEDDHGDYYCIDVDRETLINLMIKRPELEKWTPEEILRQEA